MVLKTHPPPFIFASSKTTGDEKEKEKAEGRNSGKFFQRP
jgi:hypothetical protein